MRKFRQVTLTQDNATNGCVCLLDDGTAVWVKLHGTADGGHGLEITELEVNDKRPKGS